jgi:subtilisin-like proprotein convertase family protein
MKRVNRLKVATSLALGLSAGLALDAKAVSVASAPALALTIPDNGYDGTPGSMASTSLNVPAQPGTITDVNVTLAIAHTWVGDLTIKLKSPTGTVVTLLNRPGLFTPDDGSEVGGDSSNLSASFPITFDDQIIGGTSAEDMGATLLDNEIIGDGSSPSGYIPAADAFFGESLLDGLASFNGETAGGLWMLYIGDSAAGEVGSLDSWSLTITTERTSAVPEASTALLGSMALAALAARVSARRRSSSIA